MVYSEREFELMKKYYESKLKELEKANELKDKENKALKEQNKQKDEVIHDLDKNNYRGECISLRNENKELKKKLNALEELLGITQINVAKDSSNSCKPSSTNGYKIVPQNNRVKSGRKPGQAKGHKKSSPSVSSNPDEIVRVNKVATCTCGHQTVEKEDVARDSIWLEIIVHTTQYVGKKTVCPHCGKVHMPNFPKGIDNPVNYADSIKALMAYLNTYCNVPNKKVSEVISFLTHNEVNIAPSTVLNTLSSFGKKSKNTLEYLRRQVLKSPVINEDESPIKVAGKIMSTIGIFTKKISLLKAFENRKYETFLEMGILDRYFGTVCHDHNSIHNSFVGYKDAECNFHILRYCKAQYEIHKWESIHEFMNYLLLLRDKVDEYKLEGRTCFSKEEYENAKNEYLRLLDMWDKEYNENFNPNKTKYFDEVRCLKTRLRENVDNHLRFLTDFRIDFTNNLAERRITTNKEKAKNSWLLSKPKIC